MLTAKIIARPGRFDRVDRVKAVVGEQILSGDDQFWILGEPLVVQIGDERIEIPTGFTTDGASVPDWAQRITRWKPWEDPQRWAGIVHDWLYSQPGVSKRYADDVFRAVLASEGAGWLRRKLMYAAVVIGGGPAYRSDQVRGPRILNRDESTPTPA
jgi:Protein of unknown function (DUF1353)